MVTSPSYSSRILEVPCDGGVFRHPALRCSLRTGEEIPLAHFYEEVLGLPATLQVDWLLDHKADDPEWWHEARQTMGIAAAQLAERMDADAVLTLGLEQILFTRLDGVLTVHDWFPEFVGPDAIARLPVHRLAADPGNL